MKCPICSVYKQIFAQCSNCGIKMCHQCYAKGGVFRCHTCSKTNVVKKVST